MDNLITLDYGSGGKKTSRLIEEILVPAFDNAALSALGDGALIEGAGKLIFSTDSFVVSPCFFPGGDIGKLSVCGTVNDISMCGGEPKYLSLAFIIEEGFPLTDLQKIVSSIAKTAKDCGVSVVTGDTKVVERGHGDGIYINTAGIGFSRGVTLSAGNIEEGDAVIVSGSIGDHGVAVMLARNGLSGDVISDCRPLNTIAAEVLKTGGGDVKVLRDPTRGGVATTLCEFVEGSEFTIELFEEKLPITPAVSGACDMLGIDPLYSANEGKMLAVVKNDRAEGALCAMRSLPEGENAEIIGTVTRSHPGNVLLRTAFGGTRILAKLTGAQLPRIC